LRDGEFAMPVSVQYHFSIRFRVPAKKAYEWCTSFDPSDHTLMGDENAQRKITHITDNVLLLTDTFHTQSDDVEKQKLVQLYSDQMFWTSTHLTGPNKHSQFLYQISAEGDAASKLEFKANHLEYPKENLDKAHVKLLAEKLCKEDSEAWKLLAKAMTKDFGK
jgi:hypothetical protein